MPGYRLLFLVAALALATSTGCVPHCALDDHDPACQQPLPCPVAPLEDDRGAPLLSPGEVHGWGEPSSSAFLQWSPDDAEIFYIAAGRTSVKGIRVADGQRRTLASGHSFGELHSVPATGALYATTPGEADPLMEVFSNRAVSFQPGFGSCGASCTYGPPQLVVSPDGQRIAFVKPGGMALRDLQSGAESALGCSPESSDHAPAIFSPSSNELLCRSANANTGHVVVDLATGASRPVATFPQLSWVFWNDDGILYLQWSTGFPQPEFTLTRLISGAVRRVPAHDSAGWLDLTYDASTLALADNPVCTVAAERDERGVCPCAHWGRRLHAGDFRTGTDRVLASMVTADPYPVSAVLSHDGTRLAYQVEGALYVRPVR